MNGFDRRPNPEEMRERIEKLRRVKRDLRGVGWTMLASELIQTWLAILLLGVAIGLRVAPELSRALPDGQTVESLYARVMELAAGEMGTDWYANATAALMAVVALLGLIPAYIYARNRSLDLRPAIGLQGLGAKDVAMLYVVTMGVNALGAAGVMATDALFNTAGLTVYIDIMTGDSTFFSFWMMNAYAVLLAPLIEEYIFRGALLDGMRRYGERFAVVASAVIFGLAHGNLMQFLPAVLIGWFLGYVRVKTGSWGVCVLLHALNNLTGVAMDALLTLVKSEGLYAALNLAYMAAALLAAALIWSRLKKRWGALEEGEEPMGFGALISAPALIFLYLVFETMITSVSRLA